MLAAAVTLYGLLMSFILSAGARNKRDGRANPKSLIMLGYVLLGLTAGAAAMLPMWALYDPASAAALVAQL